LKEDLKRREQQATINELKDQIMLVKKMLGNNRAGNSNLKLEVERIQKTIQTQSPAELQHRVLNAYVDSYMDKLSLKSKQDRISSDAQQLLIIDYEQLQSLRDEA